MKRTPLTRKTKHGLDLSRFPDSKGIYFDEVRSEVQVRYGAMVSQWAKSRPQESREVCERMHLLFDGTPCWNCGETVPYCTPGQMLEAHHIMGGADGRSDEPTNLAMLCGKCHSNVKTSKLPQGRILFLKWKYDRQNTDWVRLTLLGRKFLDDLITD